MPRLAALLLAGAAAPLVSGCVAAALPLVAAGAIVRQEVTDGAPGGEPRVDVLEGEPEANAPAPAPQAVDMVPPISEAPPPPPEMTAGTPPAAAAVPPVQTVPPVAAPEPTAATSAAAPATVPADAMAAAAAAPAAPAGASPLEVALADIRRRLPVYAPRGDQPYDPFIRFALEQAERREGGQVRETVMLAGPPLDGVMQLLPCGFLPPAVIIDLDDGTGNGLNLATAEASNGVVAQAGLAEGLEQLRQRDIAIIWMTSQPFDRFDAISGMLRASGLDSGGRDSIVLTRTVSERKQERRKNIAESHCILAIAGDRRADFDELYDYLRNPDAPIESDRMIGAGWFLSPQPLAAAPAPATPQP